MEELFSTKWTNESTYQNKPCYLENHGVREPCKQRTACIYHKKIQFINIKKNRYSFMFKFGTQPILIFNYENPQNFKSLNGLRWGT